MNLLLPETKDLLFQNVIYQPTKHITLSGWDHPAHLAFVSNSWLHRWRSGRVHAINSLSCINPHSSPHSKSTLPIKAQAAHVIIRHFYFAILLPFSVVTAPKLCTSCACATGENTNQFSPPSSTHPDFLSMQGQKYREVPLRRYTFSWGAQGESQIADPQRQGGKSCQPTRQI